MELNPLHSTLGGYVENLDSNNDAYLRSAGRHIRLIKQESQLGNENFQQLRVVNLLEIMFPCEKESWGTSLRPLETGVSFTTNRSLFTGYAVQHGDIKKSRLRLALMPLRKAKAKAVEKTRVQPKIQVKGKGKGRGNTSIKSTAKAKASSTTAMSDYSLASGPEHGPVLDFQEQAIPTSNADDQVPDIALCVATLDAAEWRPVRKLHPTQYRAPISMIEDKAIATPENARTVFAQATLKLLHAAPSYGTTHSMALCGSDYSRVAYIGPGHVAIEVSAHFRGKFQTRPMSEFLDANLSTALANNLELDTSTSPPTALRVPLERFASIFRVGLDRFINLPTLEPLKYQTLQPDSHVSNTNIEDFEALRFFSLEEDKRQLQSLAYRARPKSYDAPDSDGLSFKSAPAALGVYAAAHLHGSDPTTTQSSAGLSDFSQDLDLGLGHGRLREACKAQRARQTEQVKQFKKSTKCRSLPALNVPLPTLSDPPLRSPASIVAWSPVNIANLSQSQSQSKLLDEGDEGSTIEQWRKHIAILKLADPNCPETIKFAKSPQPAFLSDKWVKTLSDEAWLLLMHTRVALVSPENFDRMVQMA